MFVSGIARLTAFDHAQLRLIWSDNSTPKSQIRAYAPEFVMLCYSEAIRKSIKLLHDPQGSKHFKNTLIADFALDVHHAGYRENKYLVDETMVWATV